MLISFFGTPRHQRWRLVLLVLLALLLAWPWLDAERFRFYGSRSALIDGQKQQGYVLVGTLGRPDWPAVVVGRVADRGGVSFVTADGQPHQYQGFSGPMKALHLRAGLGGGKAFTLVFHRPPTVPEGNPAFTGIR